MFLVALPLAGEPAKASRMENRDWWSVDSFHLSRTLPAPHRALETPLNLGLRLKYHHVWLGQTVALGTSAQAAFTSFDELFWSVSAGGGLEGVWRTRSGFYMGLGTRLEYAREFTGRNNFVFDGDRYRQALDHGRSFLRVTITDLTFGYLPEALAELGLIPALRYAWLAELPLYSNQEANPWSYTELGLSVLWMWRG